MTKKKLLYIEVDTSRVGLGAALLRTRSGTSCPRDEVSDNSILRPIAFVSKRLSSTDKRYSNMEKKTLGILCGIKKFHHYCLVREVSIIKYHKPLVAILKKDTATLLLQLQWILLRLHQCRVRIIYKPGQDLFTADWLSRQNHKENIDAEIPDMQLNTDAIQTTTNIPECMTIHQLQQETTQDEHLQQLKDHIIQGWPESRDQIP